MVSAISQDALRHFWSSAPQGRLGPWEVAKALGLREASKEIHGELPNLAWIAERLTKKGGGHPTRQSLHELFAKVDSDPDWFPGKHSGVKRGPAPLLTQAKRRAIAQSAMAEPSRNQVGTKPEPNRNQPLVSQPLPTKTT